VSTTAATAPAASAQPSLRVVFGALMLVMLLASLSQMIVGTALPTIVGDLGGLAQISWVVSGYLLAQTAVTPLYGKLGDLFGRKPLLQLAIVVFLAGSALCGAAQGMTELIAFRAITGLGGGGLIVLTQALIGDFVSPRERGRYQGYFGAVFGVSSVGGPLLGGFVVDAASWRWIFYLNLPLGLLALFVLAVALPAPRPRGRQSIDYLGTALLAAALSALIVATSLGGNTWAWDSPQLILTAASGVVLVVAFVAAERRAAEPVLPLRLFAGRTFTLTAAIGLIVGLALFGATTFLPLYFQTVNGATPTESGLLLVPMVAGVLITSIGSGQMISRIGRYKPFPVVGTALIAAGFAVMSRMGPHTSTLDAAWRLLLLGLGLGLVMQVLVVAAQNAVAYRDLGVATSGATLARLVGGSLGTAVFGAIFSGRLLGQLTGGAGPPAVAAQGGRLAPDQLRELPAAAREAYVQAFTHALGGVFAVAALVALAGLVLALLLPDRRLRDTVAAAGPSEHFAMPRRDDARTEVERALGVLASRETRRRAYERLATAAGLDLTALETWTLVRTAEEPPARAGALARAAGVARERVAASLAALEGRGLVVIAPQGATVTPGGHEQAERLIALRRERLRAYLTDCTESEQQEFAAVLQRLARDLLAEPPAVHASAAGRR
jgi:EmrB/QacA subfamily drug resistance transporter